MSLPTAALSICALLAAAGLPRPAASQESQERLTLRDALELARRNSPVMAAARAALEAATAEARQAGAMANPTLSYGYEQTSAAGQRAWQSILALEQPLGLAGVRGARRDAARLRQEAVEADLRAAENQLAFDVRVAFSRALGAARRVALADQAATMIGATERVTPEAAAAGDIAEYEARRLRLESARYAVLRSQAERARLAALAELAVLIGPLADSLPLGGLPIMSVAPELELSLDSAVARALRNRPEVVAAERRAAAAWVDARAAGRQRVPVPVALAGWKTEQVWSGGARLGGFVAGLSLPLPLWDRRGGAVAAADAEARGQAVTLDAVRRRVAREAREAHAALRAVQEAVARLEPVMGDESMTALNAARMAYTKGEMPLVEWLDAVRAYLDGESVFDGLVGDLHLRRSDLQRAIGSLPDERP